VALLYSVIWLNFTVRFTVGYGQATGEAFDKYIGLQKAWGNGGFGTILLTAVAGAANGNVTGSGAEFLQNAAINVARQYTATEIKRVADSFFTVDPVTVNARAMYSVSWYAAHCTQWPAVAVRRQRVQAVKQPPVLRWRLWP
jgi:hypothetical protein